MWNWQPMGSLRPEPSNLLRVMSEPPRATPSGWCGLAVADTRWPRDLMPSDSVTHRLSFMRDSMLSADTEWLVGYDDGFDYWMSPLKIAIRVSGDDEWARWAAVIDVVSEIGDLDAAEVTCNALNAVTAGWAYCVDPDQRTISARCSNAGPNAWDQPWHRWVDAVVVAAWHSERFADGIAQLVGGRTAVSWPPGTDVPRADRDELLEWMTHVRSRPEWVFPVTSFSALFEQCGELVQRNMGVRGDSLDTNADGFVVVSYATAETLDDIHVDPSEDSVQYCVQGFSREVPAIGPGFETSISFPWVSSQLSLLGAASAANLAMSESENVSQPGAWVARGNVLDYRIFVPDFAVERLLRLPSAAEDPASVIANVTASLTHAITMLPEGDVHDDGVEYELPSGGDELLHRLIVPTPLPLDIPSSGELQDDERLLWASTASGNFAVWGIFNPVGPTLVTIDLVPGQVEGEFHLVCLMRHPFSPQYFATTAFSSTDELATQLTWVVGELAASPPEFVIAPEEDEYADLFRAAMFERLASINPADRLVDCAAQLNHYQGRAWDRLNQKDADTLPQPEEAGLWDIEMSAALEAWWEAATEVCNVSGHALEFPSAWDGAIKFLRDASEG